MRAAIITLYNDVNIGNKLQNYAVRELCEKYCDHVETIVYTEEKKKNIENSLKARLEILTGFPRKRAYEKKMMRYRRKKFENFSNKNLGKRRYISYKKLPHGFAGEYDAFFAGSDQVWHNWSGSREELDYFFLKFAPKEKRFCISPSFGFDKIPDGWSEIYAEGLRGFNRLSCREESGAAIIKDLTGQKAEVLLDPTMILHTAAWDKLAAKPHNMPPHKYLLAYFLGGMQEEIREKVLKLAAGSGVEVVDIYNMSVPEYYATAPDEFLYLLKNAEFVCTNSFHGCAFSILYHKKFQVFQRSDVGGQGMSSRLDTLLEKFGLSCAKKEMTEADHKTVDKILEEERDKFEIYLKSLFIAEEQEHSICRI